MSEVCHYQLIGPAFEGAMKARGWALNSELEQSAKAAMSEYLKLKNPRYCGKGMLFSIDQMRADDEGGEPSFLARWDEELDEPGEYA